ncbi:MAG: thioredoxin family protein [Calditrichaeota bacterium]|nr:MAG: thioredoxin family protein [Calditrichota bacterium]
MVKSFFKERRPHNGMTYDEFVQRMVEKARVAESITPEDDEQLYYTRLNYQRTSRIQKTYQVSERLKELLQGINQPQLWMVLTEAWCGDSAQTLPILAKMTECNPNIQLRILLRDENLDIMDQYLTNGTRGIPKLVAFDEVGNELFTWGPRPREAAELYRQLKAEGKEKEEIYLELHKWYAKDRGKSVEKEFMKILEQLNQK